MKDRGSTVRRVEGKVPNNLGSEQTVGPTSWIGPTTTNHVILTQLASAQFRANSLPGKSASSCSLCITTSTKSTSPAKINNEFTCGPLGTSLSGPGQSQPSKYLNGALDRLLHPFTRGTGGNDGHRRTLAKLPFPLVGAGTRCFGHANLGGDLST